MTTWHPATSVADTPSNFVAGDRRVCVCSLDHGRNIPCLAQERDPGSLKFLPESLQAAGLQQLDCLLPALGCHRQGGDNLRDADRIYSLRRAGTQASRCGWAHVCHISSQRMRFIANVWETGSFYKHNIVGGYPGTLWNGPNTALDTALLQIMI